ncbi:MAG: acetolactate synthase small subunit [Clostridia bacterium]|jgi:acetolactate synthase-1/3 small subunit|nr:acetolactate synthase small subunit [Clostridia bacterium]MBO7158633.1 acetolactate synthase small subunit [Clostridia bacterium]MBQ1254866.1 acetolactate synthase small subunit [Clostridia bacterium]MBQ2255161.1 acetolactate synthase small subunit [Clostridia bacterium]MBQ5791387.1 acetolactate synthase small subunit [Clostridia bacterium]
MEQSHVLSVFVNNCVGVLTRISGLFARRGYNIKSLTVGETENPAVSRMTIECIGDAQIITQIKSQLRKVVDVISVEELKEDAVCRELFLVKVRANDTNRTAVMGVAEIYRARTLDVTPETLVFEICGDRSKLESFFDMMKTYGIVEIARTGVTAMDRG